MSSRHHIDDLMRGRIIGKIEEGRKITDVAREFDIAHSVVSRLWKSFKTTGMCSRRHGGGRVRNTTSAENRYIVLSAKRNRRTTAQQVANQFLAASEKQISRKTVARRLRGGGLYARRPVVCVPLTRQHCTLRLQWCREHHNWTEQDWACVLFSDESRFSLSSDCRRQLIWRKSGTAYRPEIIQEKDRYPTCSIMVWAGIMINGRTHLHVVANGTMTGQRYIDEVLLPHVRLFRGAVGDKFVFMDDNATCHQTLAVQYCLDSEGIQRLVWPARSPDLNPIEIVWDALGRQVAGRNYPPTNKNTLIRALTEEWNKLPQQLLDNVVQSMGWQRGTTGREDNRTWSTAVAEIRSLVGTTVTQRTVRNRILQRQLRDRRFVTRIPLNLSHCRLRRRWCQAKALTRIEWRSIVCSDESRFCLGTSDGRVCPVIKIPIFTINHALVPISPVSIPVVLWNTWKCRLLKRTTCQNLHGGDATLIHTYGKREKNVSNCAISSFSCIGLQSKDNNLPSCEVEDYPIKPESPHLNDRELCQYVENYIQEEQQISKYQQTRFTMAYFFSEVNMVRPIKRDIESFGGR
ncbi:transposable element Tcb1 transposase [Trichonephila clavipes]|nr:transposable element Tcb1 transposase [Trichonephila clavipes]